MAAASAPGLQTIDRALRQMRHVLEPPPAVDDEGRRIETSTLLVLEAVLDAGARTVREVAQELDVAHSTASRLVTRAEEAGMVQRRPSPTSGRETLVRATELGAAVRERGLRFRLGHLAMVTEAWEPGEVETFTHLLERFAAASGGEAARSGGTRTD